jgi:hypothetical protein
MVRTAHGPVAMNGNRDEKPFAKTGRVRSRNDMRVVAGRAAHQQRVTAQECGSRHILFRESSLDPTATRQTVDTR